MPLKTDATICRPGDFVNKALVQHWPRMTDKSAVAFKRWMGLKRLDGQLVRQGPVIFLVGDAALAECLYHHSREF